MSKFIIENRSALPDADAMRYAMHVMADHPILDTHDCGYVYERAIIFRRKNQISETFIVMDGEGRS